MKWKNAMVWRSDKIERQLLLVVVKTLESGDWVFEKQIFIRHCPRKYVWNEKIALVWRSDKMQRHWVGITINQSPTNRHGGLHWHNQSLIIKWSFQMKIKLNSKCVFFWNSSCFLHRCFVSRGLFQVDAHDWPPGPISQFYPLFRKWPPLH